MDPQPCNSDCKRVSGHHIIRVLLFPYYTAIAGGGSANRKLSQDTIVLSKTISSYGPPVW